MHEQDADTLHREAATTYGPPLLTTLQIANFKAFAGEHAIPLAPLTLIYGPNAAGKSSIIQSILLLSQSIQSDKFTPRGPLVNTGGFHELVNVHDEGRELTIGVQFMIEEYVDELTLEYSGGEIDASPLRVSCGVGMNLRRAEHGDDVRERAYLEINGARLSEPIEVRHREGFDEKTGPWGPVSLRWEMEHVDSETINALAELLEKAE